MYQLIVTNKLQLPKMQQLEKLPAKLQSRLESVLQEYNELFWDEFSEGLPPERPLDHRTEQLENSYAPNRLWFQLSPS